MIALRIGSKVPNKTPVFEGSDSNLGLHGSIFMKPLGICFVLSLSSLVPLYGGTRRASENVLRRGRGVIFRDEAIC